MKNTDIRDTIGHIIEGATKPKTLYVCRPVLNGEDIIEWALDQGFKSTLPADDLHVTIAYSKERVDWGEIPDSFDNYENLKGDRHLEALGEKGDAIVLRFESKELEDRWNEICDLGASWDFPSYKPHVTISYDGTHLDLSNIEPYLGTIEFGPEEFSELDENWKDNIEEVNESLKLSDMSKILGRDADRYKEWAKTATHTADIGFYAVYHKDRYYVLLDTDNLNELVAYFYIEPTKDVNRCIVQTACVSDEYRGNMIFEQFILFLRTREGYAEIQIGSTHTSAMQKSLKRLSAPGHFKLKWISKETGEILDYDPATVDDFYGTGSEHSEWEIILENYNAPHSTRRFRDKRLMRFDYDLHYELFFENDED